MKHTRKILVALILVLTMVVGITAITASAAETEETRTVYLNPGAEYSKDNAWFAIWSWVEGQDGAWYVATDKESDGIYEIELPVANDGLKVLRMDPAVNTPDWSTGKWNESGNITIPEDKDLLTLSGWTPDAEWSTYTYVAPTFTVAGDGALCGDTTPDDTTSGWESTNTANDMTLGEDGIYTKSFTGIAAGTYEFKVLRNHSWDKAWPAANYNLTVEADNSTVTVSFNPATAEVSATAVVPQPEAPAGNTHKFDATTLTATADKEAITTYSDPYFVIGGTVQMRVDDGAVFAVETAKKGGGSIKFTVTKDHTATVVVTVSSNGSSNISYVALLDSTGIAVANKQGITEVTGTTGVSLTYELKAGTYEILSPDGENSEIDKRGVRILAIDVTETYASCDHNYVDGFCTKCEGKKDGYFADYEFDATKALGEIGKDKDALAEDTTFADGFFTAKGSNTKRLKDSAWYCIEVGKDGTGWLEFTVEGYATVSVAFASTGSSNTSAIGIINENGKFIANNEELTTVTGTGAVTVTYNLKAGIYRIVSPESEYNRGARVSLVKVTTQKCDHTLDANSICSKCEYVGPDHQHNYESVVTEPTCTAEGYTTHTCSTCGNVKVDTETEKLAHDYVNGVCSKCEAKDPDYVPPHVNTLVVGDTNKIVIGDTAVDNGYGYLVESVLFTATESAHYEFVGEGLTILVYDAKMNNLCGFTGKANLEAGTYIICIAANTQNTKGEFNVAVKKAAWNNTLAIGDNKVLITAIDNGAGYYIAWASFEVTEKANYTFTGDGILALVYDSANQLVSGTELDVGTYNICVAFLTPATTGIAPVKVEKTPLADTPVVEEPTLALGDNTVTIDGSQVNITGKAVAWYTFTPAEAGTYKFSCSDLTVYILKSKNMGDLNEYIGADGVAELEADTKYYVLVGKDGVTGEFTVKVENGAAPVHKNTVVVGDNKYIISDALLATQYEFLLIEITEGGIYKFTGGAPMTLFVFHDAYVGEALDATAPYTDNVDDITYEYVDHFYVNLAAPGFYWVGFRYDYVGELREFDINVALHSEHTFAEGKCTECGAADPNYVPPHEHKFVEGKCECGETDPNYVAPEQPKPEDPKPEELGFFQMILKAITDFFAKVGNFFSGIFGKIGGFFSGLFGGNK